MYSYINYTTIYYYNKYNSNVKLQKYNLLSAKNHKLVKNYKSKPNTCYKTSITSMNRRKKIMKFIKKTYLPILCMTKKILFILIKKKNAINY